MYFKTDVSSKEDVKKLNENVKKIGYVNILINNAGIVASNSVLEHTDEEIERIIDVNLLSNIKVGLKFWPNLLCPCTLYGLLLHCICISGKHSLVITYIINVPTLLMYSFLGDKN